MGSKSQQRMKPSDLPEFKALGHLLRTVWVRLTNLWDFSWWWGPWYLAHRWWLRNQLHPGWFQPNTLKSTSLFYCIQHQQNLWTFRTITAILDHQTRTLARESFRLRSEKCCYTDGAAWQLQFELTSPYRECLKIWLLFEPNASKGHRCSYWPLACKTRWQGR